MRRNRQPVDKIDYARAKGASALEAFQDTLLELQDSITLLDLAIEEHEAEIQARQEQISVAHQIRHEHDKAATKIAELLGQ